jgi:hypothetical protein
MPGDSKPHASFDAASVTSSTSSLTSDKEKAQAKEKKPSLLKRAVQG